MVERKKTSKLMKFLSFSLALCLGLFCMVGSSLAYCTSTGTASDISKVAKWSIKLNGKEATGGAVDFDLFTVVGDTDTPTVDDTDVKGVTGSVGHYTDKLLAPGTSGKCTVVAQNDSEVNANIGFQVAEEKSDNRVPMEYSTDGVTWKGLSDFNAQLTTTKVNMGQSKNAVFYWRWKFDNGNNALDTELCRQGGQTVKLKVTMNAVQAD